MRPPPSLELPRPRRWSWWAIAVSLAAHALLLSYKVVPWLPPSPPWLPPAIIVLVPPGAEGSRAVDMPFEQAGGAARKGQAAGITPRENEPTPTPEPSKPEVAVAPEPVLVRPAPPESSGVRNPSDSIRVYRIGPAYGSGKLWIAPLPAPPRELAEAITKSHIELVDSAVSAIVQQYIDSILNAPSGPGAPVPSWTTKIFGKTFGLDSKYIYLGGLKIPSAVLALLPIRSGGTTMEYTQASRLAAIREDLAYAAQRAQTLDDFRRAIRELRAERDRLKELERNQRKKPEPEKKDTTKKP